jgi:hypothetical protein
MRPARFEGTNGSCVWTPVLVPRAVSRPGQDSTVGAAARTLRVSSVRRVRHCRPVCNPIG